MTNLLTGDITYISVQDVRDTTKDAGILALTDGEIQSLVYQSQVMVDTYIKRTFGCSFDCEQVFIFPILKVECDGTEISYMPNDIKLATFYICESIYNNGANTDLYIGDISKENTGPHSVDFERFAKETIGLTIPQVAIPLLNKWKNVFYRYSV